MKASKVVFWNPKLRLGCHVAKQPSLTNTVLHLIEETPFDAFQIFVSGRLGGKIPHFDPVDIKKAAELLRASNKYLVIHAAYTYNLCGAVTLEKDPHFETKLANAIHGVRATLDVGAALGCGVVIHPGSCIDRKKGIQLIAKHLTACLTSDTVHEDLHLKLGMSLETFKKKRKVILENSAAEGNKLAKNLTEIAAMIQMVDAEVREQVRVCIDTAHAFGAGEYHFGKVEDVNRFYCDVFKTLGVERLEVFHLNDSKVQFGKRADRHANLGRGHQFGTTAHLQGLRKFIEEAMEHHIPLVGETPEPFLPDFRLIEALVPSATSSTPFDSADA